MKRVLGTIGAFLLGVLIFCVPIGVFGSSNIVWGEDDQYGRVDIPGQKTIHLPAREVDVSYAVFIVGKGNETVDVPIPRLSLSVQRPGGPDDVKFDKSFGDSQNADENGENSQRRVWKIDVPKEGDYRVEADGIPTTGEANPQFWFGHGPPIPGTDVPIIAAILSLIAVSGYYVRQRMRAQRFAG